MGYNNQRCCWWSWRQHSSSSIAKNNNNNINRQKQRAFVCLRSKATDKDLSTLGAGVLPMRQAALGIDLCVCVCVGRWRHPHVAGHSAAHQHTPSPSTRQNQKQTDRTCRPSIMCIAAHAESAAACSLKVMKPKPRGLFVTRSRITICA
jgi:hypothetical protein